MFYWIMIVNVCIYRKKTMTVSICKKNIFFKKCIDCEVNNGEFCDNSDDFMIFLRNTNASSF